MSKASCYLELCRPHSDCPPRTTERPEGHTSCRIGLARRTPPLGAGVQGGRQAALEQASLHSCFLPGCSRYRLPPPRYHGLSFLISLDPSTEQWFSDW